MKAIGEGRNSPTTHSQTNPHNKAIFVEIPADVLKLKSGKPVSKKFTFMDPIGVCPASSLQRINNAKVCITRTHTVLK